MLLLTFSILAFRFQLQEPSSYCFVDATYPLITPGGVTKCLVEFVLLLSVWSPVCLGSFSFSLFCLFHVSSIDLPSALFFIHMRKAGGSPMWGWPHDLLNLLWGFGKRWPFCQVTFTNLFEHSLALPFFGIGMKTDLFQSCGHC